MQRGDIWWAELPEPTDFSPGFRRPVLLIQADAFTQSRIATVIVIPLSSNLRLANAPGNVYLSAAESRLPKDSVINVSQLITINKHRLDELVGSVSLRILEQVEQGLRDVLGLWS